MKAAVRDRYGTPDVVRVVDLPTPVPGKGEVLVRTRAASVNRADLDGIQPRPGFVRLFMGLRAPRQPQIGFDVAGVVESVGPGATRFKAGDEVFTCLTAHPNVSTVAASAGSELKWTLFHPSARSR